jgi:hypothetical protein
VFRKERFCLTVPFASGFPLPILRAKDVRVVVEAVAWRWSSRWCHLRLAGRGFRFRRRADRYVARVGSDVDVAGRFRSQGARGVGDTHRRERIGLDEAARSDDAVAADRDRGQDARADPKHVVRADRGTLNTCSFRYGVSLASFRRAFLKIQAGMHARDPTSNRLWSPITMGCLCRLTMMTFSSTMLFSPKMMGPETARIVHLGWRIVPVEAKESADSRNCEGVRASTGAYLDRG